MRNEITYRKQDGAKQWTSVHLFREQNNPVGFLMWYLPGMIKYSAFFYEISYSVEWLLLRLFHIEIKCHQVYGVWQVQDIVVTALVDLLLTDLVAS